MRVQLTEERKLFAHSESTMAEPTKQQEHQYATLLVSCPDRRGLVAALAQVLAGHGANIMDADQHTDRQAKLFFQRIHFDATELVTDEGTLERAINEVAQRFDMDITLRHQSKRKRIALMVSKYDHCLMDLLWRWKAGELECDIVQIISNHSDLEPVAKHFEVPFQVFEINKSNKRAQEDAEIALLKQQKVDLVIMARYMQILSAEFCAAFPRQIINIHHSFLPAFMGGKPYHRANERGVKLIGATAHYATADLDEGPIIEQDVARCSHRDSVDDLIRKGRDLEKLVLARAVRLHIEDRILVYGNKTVVFE